MNVEVVTNASDLLIRLDHIRKQKAELTRLENEILPAIVEAYGNDELTGSKTSNTEFCKVSVTKPVSYKLENKKFEAQELASKMSPEDRVRYMKWEAKLDVKQYKTLEEIVALENDPSTDNAQLLRAIQGILTIKPGKPQVKIEVN